MLAPVHAQEGITCVQCHVPQMSEQVTEGIGWLTGSYEVVQTTDERFVPEEKALSDRRRLAALPAGVLPELRLPCQRRRFRHDARRPDREDELHEAQPARRGARRGRLQRVPQGAPRIHGVLQQVPQRRYHPRWLGQLQRKPRRLSPLP